MAVELNEEEKAVKAEIEAYAKEKGFGINPDEEIVHRVIKGMVKRRADKGELYCPCRLMTGRLEADKKIICPCEFHEEEIAEKGICHCHILTAPDWTPGA